MDTATIQPTARASGHYLDVGGVRTYYETTASGTALLLLHGGLCTAETFEKPQVVAQLMIDFLADEQVMKLF